MNSANKLLQSVGDIYAAAGSTSGWQQATQSITTCVGADAGLYFVLNRQDLTTEVSADYGYQQDDRDLYQSGYGVANDIRYQYMDNLIPGQAFREFEFVPDELAYRESKWIQLQREKYGLFWCMSARVSTHGLWHDIIAVNRLESKGPHTDEEKANLQVLLPHLSKAMELHRTVTRLENRYGAVLSVLDKLLVGLIIMDTRGRTVIANDSAKSIADRSGAFSLTPQGSVVAIHNNQNIRLQQVLSGCIETAVAQGNSDGGTVLLPSRGKSGSLLLEIMPLRDDGFCDSDNIQGAAIFVIDPDCSECVNVNALAQIFGLTEAESAITQKLSDGLSIDEISEERQASVHTVRTQLKSVYKKTGAKSQADVVRLAVKASPPIK